ncbi:MAG: hypothetical protein EBY87_02605, partial [Actinobacteria bacterium]|nr:hypothetical protein [Actinomycetota bacterium]
FIDVTRYLVAEKIADPRRVFAMGGSAGGLLMGAISNMAPGDYKALVAHVPFVDVISTMLDESIPLTTNEFTRPFSRPSPLLVDSHPPNQICKTSRFELTKGGKSAIVLLRTLLLLNS